jgi:hypothetical protein
MTSAVVPPWFAGLGAFSANVFPIGSYSQVWFETLSMPAAE